MTHFALQQSADNVEKAPKVNAEDDSVNPLNELSTNLERIEYCSAAWNAMPHLDQETGEWQVREKIVLWHYRTVGQSSRPYSPTLLPGLMQR